MRWYRYYALCIASKDISDALYRGIAVHLGDRGGKGNVFGAYPNAILGIATAGYAIGSIIERRRSCLFNLPVGWALNKRTWEMAAGPRN